ncbi:MAG: hypothetical protein ACRDRT_17230, partial [Pseudonocardiaceae bacterium]
MSQHLVISSAWPPERQPHRLIESLLADGHRVTVAAEQGRSKGFDSGDFELLILPRANDVSLKSVRHFVNPTLRAMARPSDTRRLHRRLQEPSSPRTPAGTFRTLADGWHRLLPLAGRRWDAIHLPTEVAALGFLPLIGIVGPSVVSVERPFLATSTSAEAASLLLRSAGSIQCVSEALSDAAHAWGADRTKTRVILPAVDAEFFRPAMTQAGVETRPAGGPLRLVCPSVFHWTGGHDYLLVALRKLVDDGISVHLDMVDSGLDRQRLLYTVHD